MDWTALYVTGKHTALYVTEKHTVLITRIGIASPITDVFINQDLMQNERKTDQ